MCKLLRRPTARLRAALLPCKPPAAPLNGRGTARIGPSCLRANVPQGSAASRPRPRRRRVCPSPHVRLWLFGAGSATVFWKARRANWRAGGREIGAPGARDPAQLSTRPAPPGPNQAVHGTFCTAAFRASHERVQSRDGAHYPAARGAGGPAARVCRPGRGTHTVPGSSGNNCRYCRDRLAGPPSRPARGLKSPPALLPRRHRRIPVDRRAWGGWAQVGGAKAARGTPRRSRAAAEWPPLVAARVVPSDSAGFPRSSESQTRHACCAPRCHAGS